MKAKRFFIHSCLLLFGLWVTMAQAIYAQKTTITDLRVEYLDNPIGVDMQHPRFSWIVSSDQRGVNQSAYQILVAGNQKDLSDGQADLWDTGKTQTDESVNIPYDGKELKSDHSYYWKVKVWTRDGSQSPWSSSGKFHTGLMEQSDWGGKWIGARDTTISAPVMRKEFNTGKKIKSAHVFVSGLGYYELYLNGQKIGNHKLDPGTTNYYKRALYASYDVSDYLKTGANAIGVWLGNGYFRMRRDQSFRDYGNHLQTIVQLNIKYADGTEKHVVSDPSWKTAASPITENNVYDGEVYDARKEQKGWSWPEFDDQDWSKAATVDVPGSRILSAQLMPAITVQKTIYPISMEEPVEGVYVFDFGQNLTGWPRLIVDGGEGQRVVMKTAEVTQKKIEQIRGNTITGLIDTVDTSPNRSAKARDVYILSGKQDNEEYEPRFTYHGFRYVQVEGFPGTPDLNSVAVQVAHTNVKKTGSFESSNALINKIHKNTLWGQRSNLFSVPTDCPQRDERMGWMADADLSAEEAMLNFDMAAFYTNWLRLIQDGQNKDGSVPDFVPAHKWRSFSPVGTPAWQVAYPLITWYMYKYYGDTRILREHFKSLDNWMKYMASIADDYIITKGRGDWVPPERGGAPGDDSTPLTSTGYYYQSAEIMKKISGILNKVEKQQQYTRLSEHIRDAFNTHFWNAEQQTYGTGSQTSNAFPLSVGLVPDQNKNEVVGKITENIEYNHHGKLWTGIIGTKALVNVLPAYNKTGILYHMATQREYPGWGYMISRGASTLWERWGGYRYFNAGMNSLNHIMFGSIDEFFYNNLAGIQPAGPGFKTILIQPSVLKGMNHAQGSIQTPYGRVASSWKHHVNSFEIDVTIPTNTTAKVYIPKMDSNEPSVVMESGQAIWSNQKLKQISGIKSAVENDKYITFKVGSGRYHFKLEER